MGALLQFALLIVGIPIVYAAAFPLHLTAKSLLPPLGLLAGLITAGLMVKKMNQPVSGPLTGWLIFVCCVVLAFAL